MGLLKLIDPRAEATALVKDRAWHPRPDMMLDARAACWFGRAVRRVDEAYTTLARRLQFENDAIPIGQRRLVKQELRRAGRELQWCRVHARPPATVILADRAVGKVLEIRSKAGGRGLVAINELFRKLWRVLNQRCELVRFATSDRWREQGPAGYQHRGRTTATLVSRRRRARRQLGARCGGRRGSISLFIRQRRNVRAPLRSHQSRLRALRRCKD